MIDPDNLPPQPEVLTKVLPAGGPIGPVTGETRLCILCQMRVPVSFSKCALVPPATVCPIAKIYI